MDQALPLCFWLYDTASDKTYRTRLSQSQTHHQKIVPNLSGGQSIISVCYILIEWMFLSLHQKTVLNLADEKGHKNVSEFLRGAVSVDSE